MHLRSSQALGHVAATAAFEQARSLLGVWLVNFILAVKSLTTQLLLRCELLELLHRFTYHHFSLHPWFLSDPISLDPCCKSVTLEQAVTIRLQFTRFPLSNVFALTAIRSTWQVCMSAGSHSQHRSSVLTHDKTVIVT